MRLEGKYTFEGTIERVWELLMSPEVLQACIPGCDRLEPAGQDEYEATMKIGVGPVRGTFKGKVALRDIRPPNHYQLLVEGSGGPGFVRGTATIDLVANGGATEVSMVADAQVGGPVAGVGQRMIGGVAKMQAEQFFECLRQRASEAAR